MQVTVLPVAVVRHREAMRARAGLPVCKLSDAELVRKPTVVGR